MTRKDIDTAEAIGRIRNILPSGSGVNYEWRIEIKKDAVVCDNAYDFMNETGFYDGVYPFRLRFTKNDMRFNFRGLTPYGRRRAKEEGLRDYLEELFWPVREDVWKARAL